MRVLFTCYDYILTHYSNSAEKRIRNEKEMKLSLRANEVDGDEKAEKSISLCP